MSQLCSGRRLRIECDALPNDLYTVPAPWPRLGRPVKHDVRRWTVTDDWPERVPVVVQPERSVATDRTLIKALARAG
jgi:hypothetical protein